MDTKLSKKAIAGQKIKLFPELVELRKRFQTPNYTSSPEERAQDLYNIISNNIRSKIESGCFVDIRTLLSTKQL